MGDHGLGAVDIEAVDVDPQEPDPSADAEGWEPTRAREPLDRTHGETEAPCCIGRGQKWFDHPRNELCVEIIDRERTPTE